ncbi:hypothetical protein [Neomegalonema perideroedes]|uniref:hypothetical protein n=1 Tax=Neomegalonema perideroedes TaxID=217219 RepID=UPI0003607DD7|nr:hypothetical protein [Neomegalonema perideroedes]
MDEILAWLGQNWWMGVAGIVAILGLLVTIFKSGGDKISASDGGVAIKGKNNTVNPSASKEPPKP